ANIPKPNVTELTPALPTHLGRSKEATLAKYFETLEYKSDWWFEGCERFKVRGVYLKDLWKCPKNTPQLLEEAYCKMEVARDSPADTCSGLWYDKENHLLAAIFAQRHSKSDAGPARKQLPVKELLYYTGPEGRTMADVEHAKLATLAVHYNGLPPDAKLCTHEALQFMHSMLDPEEPVAHRPGVQYTLNEVGKERVGVTHLVHTWSMQGHHEGNLTPSKDSLQGCQATMAVKWYYQVTEEVAHLLSAYFKKAFLEYHRQYSKAFSAGIWNLEDPGPWLGHALVYKLQVLPHIDGLDNGPTTCFPVAYFTGRAMHLSDLGLKLHYGLGDVIIFLSGWLYHTVQFWEPAPPPNSELTSGCIRSVFFFPDNSLKGLKGKPLGWNVDTMTGSFPSASKIWSTSR
ncbi:hypothetical protein L208DRAFT_1269430, partial [Tricholoma matsutake]